MSDALQQVALGDNWTPAQDQQVLALKEQGFSYAQIAKLLPGRTERAIQARWRRLRDRRDDEASPIAGGQPAARATDSSGTVGGGAAASSPMVFHEDADIVHVHTDQGSAPNSRPSSAHGTSSVPAGSTTSSAAPIVPRTRPTKTPRYLDPTLSQQAPPRGGMRMAELDVTSTHGYRKLLVKPTGGWPRSNKTTPPDSLSPTNPSPGEASWAPQPKIQKDWTAEEDGILLMLKEQNLTFDQIAARLDGRSKPAVENRYFRIRERLREAEIAQTEPAPSAQTLTPIEPSGVESSGEPRVDGPILELSAKHWTDKAIAKHLGMSTDEVRQRRLDLRNARVSSMGKRKSESNVEDPHPEKVRMRKRWTMDEDEKLHMLKTQTDLTWPQIAEQFPDRTVKGLTEHWSDLKGSGKLKQMNEATNGTTIVPHPQPTTQKMRSPVVAMKNGTAASEAEVHAAKRMSNGTKKVLTEASNPWNSVNRSAPIQLGSGSGTPTDASAPHTWVHTVFVGGPTSGPPPTTNVPMYRMQGKPFGGVENGPIVFQNGFASTQSVGAAQATTGTEGALTTSLYGESYETLPKPAQWAKKNGGVPGFFTTETYQKFYKTYKATSLPPRPAPQLEQAQQPHQQQIPLLPPQPIQYIPIQSGQPAPAEVQPVKRAGLANLLNPETTPTPPSQTPLSSYSQLPPPDRGPTPQDPRSQPIYSTPPITSGPNGLPGQYFTFESGTFHNVAPGSVASAPLPYGNGPPPPSSLPLVGQTGMNSAPSPHQAWANGATMQHHQQHHVQPPQPPQPQVSHQANTAEVADAADAAAIASLPADLRNIRPWDILSSLEGKELSPEDKELYSKAVSVLAVMSRVTVSK